MNFIYYVLLFTLYPFIVQSQIKLEKITPKISNLWGIAIINKDEILVTQRSGNVYRLNVFNKNIIKIEGTPKVYNSGQGGLLDIAFEKENNVQRVYLCLSKVIPSNKSSTAIHSYNLKNNKLTNDTEQPLVGVIKYTDGAFDINTLVGFTPNSEYEFVIEGKRLYRVLNKFITIKYEYKGNEEEYNPSWAKSS